MKAIKVSRVSTEEQKEAGNSLPAQIKRIDDYCKRKGFEVIRSFSFDESAYKDKRDEFDKLVEYVQDIAKKEKIAVCFDKVDRLSRSVFDSRVGTLYQMSVEGKIELHFVSDNQVLNGSLSATEKGGFGMSLVMASYYSNAISDNVKRAFEQKRRNGEWTGGVRIGYKNVSLDVEKRLRKDIILDPDRAHLVQMIFELYATGNYSMEAIRVKITEMGLRTRDGNVLSKSGIENILKDSFFCGIAVSKKYNLTWVHNYPRITTREIFDKCQELRAKRKTSRPKSLSKDFIFKGLLKCQNCGCSMSAEIKKGRFVYYSCTNAKRICKRVYVPEKTLLEPVYELLGRFESIKEEVQDGLVRELRKNTESEVVFHKAQISRITSEYEQIKSKDDRLLERYLEDSTSITKDIYDKKHQEYADALQVLEIELSENRKADYDYQTTVATVVSVARRAKQIFEGSEPSEKRALLNYILQNPTVNEKKLCFSIASPFNLVLDLADSPIWLRG
ncbi:MAG: recombinase family protein [Candidatus Paceibacterota bacterium]